MLRSCNECPFYSNCNAAYGCQGCRFEETINASFWKSFKDFIKKLFSK